MEADELAEWLRAVRRLRRGTLEMARAPARLTRRLGAGLGPVCDGLATRVRVPDCGHLRRAPPPRRMMPVAA